MIKFDNDWDSVLEAEFALDNYRKIRDFLKVEYSQNKIFPDMYDIFNAFKATSYDNIKVVIIGQDPYHNDGQAHGMCFSVRPDVDIPPSLLNIYKELNTDLGCKIANNGYLVPWANQGVLLLNAVLTVRAHQANSHAGHGWEVFTDNVIRLINKREKPVIFLLWGNYARKKAELIDKTKHFILESAHPSPLSCTRFFGCRHFSKTNELLKTLGSTPIDWQIPDIIINNNHKKN